ncbi:MAG TPA: hypothetical protein VFO38_01560 [Candidatus Saccharimonadales bacterium]|nr:hypothetical protein [Candidatus Saccharimonadales bacterium]
MHFDGWKQGLDPETVEQVLEAVVRLGESSERCAFLSSLNTDPTEHDTQLLMEHILGCRACAVKVATPPSTT